MPKKQIYLTGFMGTGKSMILNCLHEVCGFDKIEMDEQIVQEQGIDVYKRQANTLQEVDPKWQKKQRQMQCECWTDRR